MEIRVLKYFLAVTREENISKAAKVLHITQPTLSRQLAQLEEETGVCLFTRGTRKIALTNEGMLLRRRAEEIISLVDKTQTELLDQDSHVDGTITIGCGVLYASQILAEVISSFRQKYPLVKYDLFTANADLTKEYMDKGIIDIGLLLEPISISKYEFIRLKTKEEWCVTMPPDDSLCKKESISPEDLLNKPLIFPRRVEPSSELANWFGDYYSKLQIQFVSNFSSNAFFMVKNKLGYALNIRACVTYWDKNIICAKPLNPKLFASSVFAWKRNQPANLATTKFIEHLKWFLNTHNL